MKNTLTREALVLPDLLIVQPALEPFPRGVWRFGKFAAFFYVRWSTVGLGVEILSAGAAIILGPVMFGVCHVKRQLAAGDAAREAGE